MKIKQSFIDRCGEITVNQIQEISKISGINQQFVFEILLEPNGYVGTVEVIKATANVLKIDLSDIYEVEQTPNTLTE